MATDEGKVNEKNKQMKKSNLISLFECFMFYIGNTTAETVLCEWVSPIFLSGALLLQKIPWDLSS